MKEIILIIRIFLSLLVVLLGVFLTFLPLAVLILAGLWLWRHI